MRLGVIFINAAGFINDIESTGKAAKSSLDSPAKLNEETVFNSVLSGNFNHRLLTCNGSHLI